jgi:hypothetical protein
MDDPAIIKQSSNQSLNKNDSQTNISINKDPVETKPLMNEPSKKTIVAATSQKVLEQTPIASVMLSSPEVVESKKGTS